MKFNGLLLKGAALFLVGFPRLVALLLDLARTGLICSKV